MKRPTASARAFPHIVQRSRRDPWRKCSQDSSDNTPLERPKAIARASPHIMERSGVENGHGAEAREPEERPIWQKPKSGRCCCVRACVPPCNAAIKARLLAKKYPEPKREQAFEASKGDCACVPPYNGAIRGRKWPRRRGESARGASYSKKIRVRALLL